MKIPFSPPDITEAEIEQVAEALRSGWITTGPKTKELEREVADLCGTNRAVSVLRTPVHHQNSGNHSGAETRDYRQNGRKRRCLQRTLQTTANDDCL